MTLKEVARHLKEGDKLMFTNGEHYGVGINPNGRGIWEYYDDEGEYALMNALYMEGYVEINHLCLHRLHFMEKIVETFKLDLTQSELADIESKYSGYSTMTLKEVERQLNDGDSIVLTNGEHFGVRIHFDTDFEIYSEGELMYFIKKFSIGEYRLNNVCVHRLHFNTGVIETFKLNLSLSELEEINTVRVKYRG